MFYEVVYRLSASEAGLALLPLVALSVPGSWVAGRVMLRRHRYLWVSVAGGSLAAVCFASLAFADRMPLWVFLLVLSVGSLGVGPMFSTTMATMQNAVARSQIGTATGAMNYSRALMSSFAVAGFTAILMAALGASAAGRDNIDLARELSGAEAVSRIPLHLRNRRVMMAGAALSMALMEERPLAGPERDQARARLNAEATPHAELRAASCDAALGCPQHQPFFQCPGGQPLPRQPTLRPRLQPGGAKA